MADRDNGQQNENPRENEKNERRPWDIRPYLAIGLTAVIVIFVALAIFFFFYRFEGFSAGVGALFSSLLGIILGLILAFLLNPVMRFFERLLRKGMFKKAEERSRRQNRVIRGLAVAIAMTSFLVVAFILLWMIVPQLLSSVTELVTTLDEKLQTLVDWINRLFGGNSALAEPIEELADRAFDWVYNWLEVNILGAGDGDFIQTLVSGVGSAFRILIDIIIGIIVAIYVLMTKERFIGQAKKLIYAIFRPRAGNVIVQFFHKGNEVFGGFFVGKIIDSVIVGFICLAFMAILHFPYIALISVIIGVTNIIPVFGPFIGAIPSVVLIFLVDPIYALYFVIFIIVLQQVDGNIIGPRILGNTTDLSPFWIIFAILLFGGAFGIIGMIFGVPIFAMIYYVIKRIAEFVLHRKKLPEETMEYVYVENIDPETLDITYRESDDGRRAFSAFNPRKNRESDVNVPRGKKDGNSEEGGTETRPDDNESEPKPDDNESEPEPDENGTEPNTGDDGEDPEEKEETTE